MYLGTSYDPETDPGKSEVVSKLCSSSGLCNDYWAGAKNACQKIGMNLPDENTLVTIFSYKTSIPNLTLPVAFWSSSEGQYYEGITVMYYSNRYHIGGVGGGTNKHMQNDVICVE
ncbi:hypothetical protein J6P92_01260 [bacterium]|nr:hypothetical protein [bacterium]